MANQVERINKLEKEVKLLSVRLKGTESQQKSRATIGDLIVNAVVGYFMVVLILLAGELADVSTAVTISFIAPASVILARVANLILKRYLA